ncbi:MAG: hypothetical protein GY940_04805 [bacterium]|nr:hypothetical protein [bacterium]
MNTKKIKKKLVLGKTTVTNLDNKGMNSVHGGGTEGRICVNMSLEPQVCAYTEGMCTRLDTCWLESFNCPITFGNYDGDTFCV